jgi:hypothetical protein
MLFSKIEMLCVEETSKKSMKIWKQEKYLGTEDHWDAVQSNS